MFKKEVLRTGTFTDASGKKVVITEKDLNELAKNFNSETAVNSEGYKVPLFLGHPSDESTAPAHGWIKRISAEGGRLLAEFDKLTEAAEKAIKNFSFRDVSVSIYKNILQHIGLTNTPAVPGLADFQFENAHKDDCSILTFKEPTKQKGGDMPSENEIKLVGEKKDLEVKLTAVQAEVETLKTEKVELAEAKSALEEEKTELSKSNTELSKENETLKQKMEDEKVAAELKADTDFVENLCSEGILKPADKEATINRLTKYPTNEIEEGKTAKDLYKESLSAKGIEHSNQDLKDGVNLAKGEQELIRLSNERAKEKGISYTKASEEILQENPHLDNEAK